MIHKGYEYIIYAYISQPRLIIEHDLWYHWLIDLKDFSCRIPVDLETSSMSRDIVSDPVWWFIMPFVR